METERSEENRYILPSESHSKATVGSSAQKLPKDRKGEVESWYNPPKRALNVCVQINLQHIVETTRDSEKNLLVVCSEADYISTATRLVQKLRVFFHFVFLFTLRFFKLSSMRRQLRKESTKTNGCTYTDDYEDKRIHLSTHYNTWLATCQGRLESNSLTIFLEELSHLRAGVRLYFDSSELEKRKGGPAHRRPAATLS